jgi:hypothetical protein
MADRGRPSAITTDKIKGFKRAIESGASMHDAMISELGLAESVARKGKAGLSKRVLSELAKDGMKFVEIGRQLTAQDQEHFVRGRLYTNALQGKDAGVNSLKLLGQDKRVNMFTPDSVAGIVVIEAPKSLPSIPVLDAEVIQTPQLDSGQ